MTDPATLCATHFAHKQAIYAIFPQLQKGFKRAHKPGICGFSAK